MTGQELVDMWSNVRRLVFSAALATVLGCSSGCFAAGAAEVTPVFGAGLEFPCGVSFVPRVALRGWIINGAAGGLEVDDDGWRQFRIRSYSKPGSPVLCGKARFQDGPSGAISAEWRVKPSSDLDSLELFAGGRLDAAFVGGGSAVVDGRSIPLALDGAKMQIFRGAAENLELRDRSGAEVLRIAFVRPTRILLQDGAALGGAHLTIRLFFAEGPVKSGVEYAVDASISCPLSSPLSLASGTGFTINEGPDWLPILYEPMVVPGSALDFTSAMPRHAPAGKFGRVEVRGRRFEFKDRPGVPQRFYGVNLCGDANFPSSHKAADRFAENLARIGYNAVRIHHHERYMVAEDGQLHPESDDTSPSPGQWEKFDNLVAACVERGIYLTTDLFVSRSYVTSWRAIGIDRDGAVPVGNYKVLCAFHEPAYSNLCAWARNFLGHVNPHTGRSLAEEPALATLSLINEGNLGAFGAGVLRETPGVLEAWARWLAERRGGKDGSSFADIPDTIPDALTSNGGSSLASRHSAAFAAFLAERETLFFERLKRFVREECGCPAPLSNLSASWFNPVQYQIPRTHFDYVDDHFYVDHPSFLETPWLLPLSCDNVNPVKGVAAGARDVEWRRLMDKPFCVSEWNYAAPGRFRGVGGLATGALGALQGWNGIWRFAWSHGRRGIERPGRRLGCFDVNDDPIAYASERAAICLFLRGDVAELAEESPVVLDESALLDPASGAKGFPAAAKSLALGWTAKVGTIVARSQERSAADADSRREAAKDAPCCVHACPSSGVLAVDTPMTCGGFAERGRIDAGALSFELVDLFGTNGVSVAPPTTLWASSLDGAPIATSRHILVVHLTDVQMEGARYGDVGCNILLDWGRSYEYLVRRGRADVELRLEPVSRDGDGQYADVPRVFAVGTSGRRMGEVPSCHDASSSVLRFAADTRGPGGKGCMFYEIVR